MRDPINLFAVAVLLILGSAAAWIVYLLAEGMR